MGTKVYTNVALSTVHLPRSLASNIEARRSNAIGTVQGSWTRHRGEPDESIVYMVWHDAAEFNAPYFANEFNVIAGADQGELEGCIMSTYASAKAELEALEEILAKHYHLDSHVREQLMQLARDGRRMNEDDPTIGHVVCAWQEALGTFANWPEDDMSTDPKDAADTSTTPGTQRTLPPIQLQLPRTQDWNVSTMITTSLRNCPSARTLYKRLMRGAHSRSRIFPKVSLPLAAYTTMPPAFTPPGKALSEDTWEMPPVNGCTVEIRVNSYGSNFDPRKDPCPTDRELTPTVVSERPNSYDSFTCGVYTANEDDTSYTSIVDAAPSILAGYLARLEWVKRHAEGSWLDTNIAVDTSNDPDWMADVSNACYGWHVKGCYASIIGDCLVFEPTVKSCYRNRVKAFCKSLAAALKTCAKAGVKVHVGRGE
jgi:hypothetical protein